MKKPVSFLSALPQTSSHVFSYPTGGVFGQLCGDCRQLLSSFKKSRKNPCFGVDSRNYRWKNAECN
jgi:hypothetical protein